MGDSVYGNYKHLFLSLVVCAFCIQNFLAALRFYISCLEGSVLLK